MAKKSPVTEEDSWLLRVTNTRAGPVFEMRFEDSFFELTKRQFRALQELLLASTKRPLKNYGMLSESELFKAMGERDKVQPRVRDIFQKEMKTVWGKVVISPKKGYYALSPEWK